MKSVCEKRALLYKSLVGKKELKEFDVVK